MSCHSSDTGSSQKDGYDETPTETKQSIEETTSQQSTEEQVAPPVPVVTKATQQIITNGIYKLTRLKINELSIVLEGNLVDEWEYLNNGEYQVSTYGSMVQKINGSTISNLDCGNNNNVVTFALDTDNNELIDTKVSLLKGCQLDPVSDDKIQSISYILIDDKSFSKTTSVIGSSGKKNIEEVYERVGYNVTQQTFTFDLSSINKSCPVKLVILGRNLNKLGQSVFMVDGYRTYEDDILLHDTLYITQPDYDTLNELLSFDEFKVKGQFKDYIATNSETRTYISFSSKELYNFSLETLSLDYSCQGWYGRAPLVTHFSDADFVTSIKN